MLRWMMLGAMGGLFGCPTVTTPTETDDDGCDRDETTTPDGGCEPLPTGDTGPSTTPIAGYTLSFLQLGIDANGDVVPFDVTGESGTVTAEPAFLGAWLDDDNNVICASEYDVSSSSLSGGPYPLTARASGPDPEAQTQTWNAWEWTLTYTEDSCKGLLDADDTQFITDFIPSSLYIGIGPAVGSLGDFASDPNGAGIAPQFAGMMGLWGPGDDTDAESPDEGGEFFDQRVFAVLDWDGSSVVDADVEGKDISTLLGGSNVLTNAVLTDQGGWEFTFNN